MVENLNTIIDTRNATASNVFAIKHELRLEVERREEERRMLYYLEMARKRFFGGGDATLSNIIHALKR